ncbi:nuclear transport factor 2 family protein [Mycobacterium sp. SMC-4]|uniref:nuclear transport factor 2 family protein n=1 Tax=Mycobacterium sp. SMC-4 TaxID=2857059 RepID=UPI0021B273E0|nr:nuclear transport factor 2 family protein [Mycobacterium sp. SMC-4]UXA17705.1 nuclear transport factor 2 family protein [Mycobacterium sp. SMC-4]
MTDSDKSRNASTVRAAFDAWAAGSGSPYDLLADDVTWEIMGNCAASRVYHGKEDFLSSVIRPFNARMSRPLVPSIRRIHADGDTVIVLFDAEGVARDEVVYRNTYAWFLTLEGDRVVAASAFFDALSFDDLWGRLPG